MVFISISHAHRKTMTSVINSISSTVENYGLIPLVFTDHYILKDDDYKSMMKTAFQYIDESVCLISELSHQAIGVGIEIGYAKAKGKPIIYLLNKREKLSTTALGTADYYIQYNDHQQIKELLSPILISLYKQKYPTTSPKAAY